MISLKELRKFGFLVGGIFLLFGRPHRLWPWGIGAILCIFAGLWPKGLTPVYRIWMKIGHFLGMINTFIILTLVFYCIMTPLGWVMRLTKWDPMKKSFDKNAPTYWEKVERVSSLERPF